jgi:hypothetical protein
MAKYIVSKDFIDSQKIRITKIGDEIERLKKSNPLF